MPRPGRERAEELFEEALALPSAARQRFLDEACDGDTQLANEIASLVNAHEASGAFLDSPAVGLDQEEVGEDRFVGRQIGRYRLVRLMARGGMGAVYEAEQDEPRRPVALKLLSLSLQLAGQESRFRRELEILGRLRHPAIAQVFEGGVHDERGERLPFISMELVPDAESIAAFCNKRELPIGRRVELFAELCDAVHYAHLRGVVHRDLKPANLLVDGTGQPKVIDFGVARLVDEDNGLTQMTVAGQILGTLEYMSPEQCEGEELDVRADVYSLGLVLYELLCGKPAYDLSGMSVTRALRRRLEPPPPPRSVAPLARDYESVVLHAIERDPDRRYPSAEALADDLRCILRHEPIRARPPSKVRAGALFVRRHLVLVSALTVVIVTLAVATVVSLDLLQQSRSEAVIRGKTLDLVLDIFTADSPDKARGEERRLSDLLPGIPERIEEQLVDNPRSQAFLFYHFGNLSQQAGQRELAQRMLERAIELAETHGIEDEVFARMQHVLGQALRYSDRERAVELYRAALERMPDTQQWSRYRRTIELDIGQLLVDLKQFAEAREILERRRSQLDALPSTDTRQSAEELAVCLDGLARIAQAGGEIGKALRYYDAAIAVLEPHGLSSRLVTLRHNRGVTRKKAGDLERAREDLQRSLAMQTELLPAASELCRLERSLSRLYLVMKRPEEMLEHQEKAIDHFEAAFRPDSYATVNVQFGFVSDRIELELFAEAEALARAILPLQRQVMGATHASVVTTLDHMAVCAETRGDAAEAIALREQAAEVRAAANAGK